MFDTMAMSRLLVLTIILLAKGASAGKIIALPLCGAPSHVFIMWKVCRELTARGHAIKVVAAESDADALGKLDWSGMEVETYVAAYNQSAWRDQARKARFKDPIQGGLEAVRMWGQQCDLLLSDQPLTARLKEFGADVLFGDWAYYCTPALSEVLKLPRVTVSNIPILDPVHTSWDRSTGRRMHAANMLAYTPQVGTGFPSTMNFAQRVENVITYAVASLIDWTAFHRMIYKPLGEEHGIDLGTPEALGRGVMHLFNVDFALEFPRKLPPNVKLVGPLMPEPPKPLPADLEEFMAGSGDTGVVYVSLGTVCSIGAQEFKELAAALSALPAHVIWKVGADDLPQGISLASLGLGDNVKVVQWAPQNDLLGHAKTRAFLTHGGVNGLYEAAYHGVPIAGIPLIADQKDNVAKAVYRGFGLAVDPRGGLTAARIGGVLRRLLAEPGFRAAAAKLSRRLRSRPRTPAQEAADWVQHVIETEGEPYLHTPEDAIPLASLLLLDVFAFLLIAMLAPMGLAWVVGSRLLAHVRTPKAKTL